MVTIHIIMNKHTINESGQLFSSPIFTTVAALAAFGSYAQSEDDLSLGVYQKPWSK